MFNDILFTCKAIAYQAPGIGEVILRIQLDKLVPLGMLLVVSQAAAHSSTEEELLTKKSIRYASNLLSLCVLA
jgi:hypothetical protein